MSKNLNRFIGGLCIGTVIGLLVAPKKGTDTRKELKEKIDNTIYYLKEFEVSDIKDITIKKLKDLKKSLEELDGETIVSNTSKKINKVKKQVSDLAKYTKDKSSPYVAKVCSSIKDKTYYLLDDTLEKIETKN